MIKNKLFTLLFLCVLIFSSHAFSQELQPRIETNWRYSNQRNILMSEFWVPFFQEHDRVLYSDYRIMGDNLKAREFNIGVGYREIQELPFLKQGILGGAFVV